MQMHRYYNMSQRYEGKTNLSFNNKDRTSHYTVVGFDGLYNERRIHIIG